MAYIAVITAILLALWFIVLYNRFIRAGNFTSNLGGSLVSSISSSSTPPGLSSGSGGFSGGGGSSGGGGW